MTRSERLDPHEFWGEHQPCFGCSPEHPIGFRLDIRREGDVVRTTFVPGENYQGPPGLMHGGLVTTLADEIAAWCVVAVTGKFGFTGKLSAKLAGPVRIGVPVVASATIVSRTTRTVDVDVVLAQGDTTPFTGQFLFVLMNEAGAERVLGGPVPDAWRRFLR